MVIVECVSFLSFEETLYKFIIFHFSSIFISASGEFLLKLFILCAQIQLIFVRLMPMDFGGVFMEF